jgi:hypothetical protein
MALSSCCTDSPQGWCFVHISWLAHVQTLKAASNPRLFVWQNHSAEEGLSWTALLSMGEISDSFGENGLAEQLFVQPWACSSLGPAICTALGLQL